MGRVVGEEGAEGERGTRDSHGSGTVQEITVVKEGLVSVSVPDLRTVGERPGTPTFDRNGGRTGQGCGTEEEGV